MANSVIEAVQRAFAANRCPVDGTDLASPGVIRHADGTCSQECSDEMLDRRQF